MKGIVRNRALDLDVEILATRKFNHMCLIVVLAFEP